MKRIKQLLIFLLFSSVLYISFIQVTAPEIPIYSQDFEGSSSWTVINGNWDFNGNMLNGIGVSSDSWDDIVLNDMIFYEHDYTIIFDVLLHPGYGAEQFHFIFNYNTGYAVMELSSDTSMSHYIDTTGIWSNLNISFPLGYWAKVHMAISGGKVDLWVDTEVIYSESVMMAPYLEQIGFGLYANSSAQFDNILIYNTAFGPDIPSDTEQIFHDDYSDYNLWNRYVPIYGSEIQWNVIGDSLEGKYPENASADYGWIITQGFEFVPDLDSFTIKVKFDVKHTSQDEIFLLNWGFSTYPEVQTIKYSPHTQMLYFGSQGDIGDFYSYNSYSPDEPLTWGELVVAVDVKDGFQHTDVFLSTMGSDYWGIFSHEENMIYDGGNIGFGMKRYEPTTETLVYWDELDYRRGYCPPDGDPSPEGPKLEDFGVKIGDTFTYQLMHLGPSTEINLNMWFYHDTTSFETSFFVSEGDEIKLVITGFLDYNIEMDVYQNDIYMLTAVGSFFFLPINANVTDIKMFDGGYVDQYGDQYTYTMAFENETTSTITGEVEFRWDVTTGVLESVEVISGLVEAGEVFFDDFYFELISSTADIGTDTDSIPNLTPGWDLVSVMSIFLILPIYLRKRNRI